MILTGEPSHFSLSTWSVVITIAITFFPFYHIQTVCLANSNLFKLIRVYSGSYVDTCYQISLIFQGCRLPEKAFCCFTEYKKFALEKALL